MARKFSANLRECLHNYQPRPIFSRPHLPENIEIAQADISYNELFAVSDERELRREQQQREYEPTGIINKTRFSVKSCGAKPNRQNARQFVGKNGAVGSVASDKPSGNFKLQKSSGQGQSFDGEDGNRLRRKFAKNINLASRGIVGVIGANGTGKTTFLKTILGSHRELNGKIIWGIKTNIGYYSQNLETLDERNEVIHELRRVAPLAENGELRSFLARFLFSGETVFKSVAIFTA